MELVINLKITSYYNYCVLCVVCCVLSRSPPPCFQVAPWFGVPKWQGVALTSGRRTFICISHFLYFTSSRVTCACCG